MAGMHMSNTWMSRLARVVALAGVFLTIGACSAFEPDRASAMTVPAIYREWFAKTEACSGRTGDFDRIKWHIVNGRTFECPVGACVGYWEDTHHIYIAAASQMDELVVSHEILHDLIGHPGHPNPPFDYPCRLTWVSRDGASSSRVGRVD
jgi:hypothetical protein